MHSEYTHDICAYRQAMWYASLGFYGQGRPSQECAKFDFSHPSGGGAKGRNEPGGAIIADPKTHANKYVYIKPQ